METHHIWILIAVNSTLGVVVAVLDAMFWEVTRGFVAFSSVDRVTQLYGSLAFPATFPLLHVFGPWKCDCGLNTMELIPLYWFMEDGLVWLYILLAAVFGIFPKAVWNLLGLFWVNIFVIAKK